ncbi:hypothetical protein B0I35DRAFT_476590 [Stachybotrys elegans]|uniref:Uncharacterized protein n=1 Tax=Stachybotrys elegans TaxID=80388 RepID=A0A8K0SVE6_9HYPO|nr:hypothetical protein B0I35DRAFT_476590 [Stachybotrys elegans]
MIYKDDDAIRTLLRSVSKENVTPETLGLKVLNQAEVSRDKDPKPPRYFSFESEKGGLDYTITSLGHPIGLKTEYPASSLKVYKIKLRKGRDPAMKKRIRRGVSQHDVFDLMRDVVRLGIITQAELIGAIMGKTVGGSILEDGVTR